jgi:parallel beta-helix repeat protein
MGTLLPSEKYHNIAMWGAARTRLFLVVLLLAVSLVAPITSAPARASTGRGPITIESDANFTAANGVVSGRGTSTDPYVISDWEITGPVDPAISIHATRSWFVIRNVTTIRGGYYEGYRGGGIRLDDVQNGRVEDVVLQGTTVGLTVQGCAHLHLSRIAFHDSPQGLTARDSTDLSVTAIQSRSGWPGGVDTAVRLWNVSSAIVKDNVITASNREGIGVYLSRNVTVKNNTVSHAQYGIYVRSQNGGVTVRNNNLTQNGDGDLVLEDSSNISIQGNRLASYGAAEPGFVVRGALRSYYDSHNISADNTVAGLPLVVVERLSRVYLNATVAGQVYVAGCTDVHLQNLSMAVLGTGITLAFVDRGTIQNSTFRGDGTGILLRYAKHISVFHNNFMPSARPSDQFGANNSWDNGYPSGGNYYWNYWGRAANRTGLGDVPWAIYEYDVDRYPLVRPYGLPPRPPVVVFSVSATRVQATGSFTFDGSGTYDPDGHIVSGQWNFGDGTLYAFPGITSGSYAYQQAGNYTLTLTVTDNLDFAVNHSQAMVVTPYVPPASVLPSIGAAKMMEHVGDFRIPVPDDWSVQFDATAGSTKVSMVAIGPTYNGFRTNLIVFSGRDSSVRETRGFMDGLVQGTLAGVQNGDPSAYLDGTPEFLAISNHSAVSFVIQRPNSGATQRIAEVVSEAHGGFWAIVLSFDHGLSGLLAPLWGTMLTGFVITAAVPPPALLIPLVVVGSVVTVVAVVVLLGLRFRRTRVRPPADIPMSSSMPSGFIGTDRLAFCPRCGAPSLAGALFCANCGMPSAARSGPNTLEPPGEPPKSGPLS